MKTGKILLSAFLAFSVLAPISAQDLNEVTVVDQLNTGARGNEFGSGTSGAAKLDATEYSDYSGPDISLTRNGSPESGSIRYINSWATNNPLFESPIVDFTTVGGYTNPDRSTIKIPAILANNRPGATDGAKGVTIGDDGGFNSLFWGDNLSRNYYVEADVYCWHGVSETNAFEMAGIAARAGRDNPTFTGSAPNPAPVTDLEKEQWNPEFTYNVDRVASYALVYDYQFANVKAVRWTAGNTSAQIVGRNAVSYTQFGSTVNGVSQGWHTMRIEAVGSNIKFYFDGALIADVIDTAVTYGRPGIYYREANVTSANERQGTFDQLRSGPTANSDISEWGLY